MFPEKELENSSSNEFTEFEINEMLNQAIKTRSKLSEDFFLTDEDKKLEIKEKRDVNYKRRPCANCSCKRQFESNIETEDVRNITKSSCGSCYLGDAFRCAGCPFLGKPAFEPGEEAFFNSDDLN